jgi:hypothetical protein
MSTAEGMPCEWAHLVLTNEDAINREIFTALKVGKFEDLVLHVFDLNLQKSPK